MAQNRAAAGTSLGQATRLEPVRQPLTLHFQSQGLTSPEGATPKCTQSLPGGRGPLWTGTDTRKLEPVSK